MLTASDIREVLDDSATLDDFCLGLILLTCKSSPPSHFLLRPPGPSFQVFLLHLHGLDIYWYVFGPASTTLDHLVDPSILVHVVYDGRQHSVLRWVPPMEVLCCPASHP